MTGSRNLRARAQPVLITGGCGFIGCNIADALAARGERLLILDSLARDGVQENAQWLKDRHGDSIEIKVADVRDEDAVIGVVRRASAVFHLAGQVAVTRSVERPVEDFEINARGTLNVLEAVRLHNPDAPIIFASTNKVYGRLLDIADIERLQDRYAPVKHSLSAGIAENMPLDLYSPYGCSKGTADQYVRDYARIYGLQTVVLRMSCIYGPRQFGTEDQGWIAHFLIQAIRRNAIVIYGNGLQVRDALHVSDAAAAWIGVLDRIDDVSGRIFNLGGGPQNTVSLIELLDLIAKCGCGKPLVRFDQWRPGDQPWYVTDISAISSAIGWRPRVPFCEGLASLAEWLAPRFRMRERNIEDAAAERVSA